MPNRHNKTQSGLAYANLNRLAHFVAVVETGSFTAAAERLDITKSVVSQQVARLEREFRTTLLVRSTRRVRTTEAGQALYARCASLLKQAEDAFDELTESAGTPSGTLRLTAPFDYGVGVIVPAIIEFATAYPACKVDSDFTDRTMNLMDSDFDLAIRVGWLTEQHLQARRIGSFGQCMVSAPRWRSKVVGLRTPADLAALPIIANTALREPTRWRFSHDHAGQVSVTMQANLRFDATLAVREAVLAGAGLSVLPDYVVANDLAEGRLAPVLEDWTLPRGDIHAVFPTARFRPAKVRAFVDLLAGRVGD